VSAPLWAQELAAGFWAAAGGEKPFPRDLRRPAACALPLTVVPRPGLRVRTALDWLRDQGIDVALGAPDRPLRACLVARADCGFVFLDAADDAAEQRFSLAHELAHYLRDYWRPRRRAERRLGPAALAVLDGRRPPRPEERLHALLRGAPLALAAHLLARDPGAPPPAVAAAERAADRLACELLAPAAEVEARLGPHATAADAAALLRGAFGLPAAEAGRYAAELVPPAPAPDPLVARLRIVSNFGRGAGTE
jgi:hypothetical protein